MRSDGLCLHIAAEYFKHGLGMERRHFQHVKELLALYNAEAEFCVLAEDATALQVHLEAVREGDKVLVYGLNGGAVQVRMFGRGCAIHWLFCSSPALNGNLWPLRLLSGSLCSKHAM